MAKSSLLVSILILAATIKRISSETIADAVTFAEIERKELSVNVDLSSDDASEVDVTVRFKVVVDNVIDEGLCSDTWTHMSTYKFVESVKNSDGSMNSEINMEQPHTLHVIGGLGLQCVHPGIIKTAITVLLENIDANVAEAISLAEATAMRVLILDNVAFSSVNFNHNILLAAIKYIGNTESPDVLQICKELTKYPCILNVEIDHWNGRDLAELIETYLQEGTKVEYVLRHMHGHEFVISHDEMLKVHILPSEQGNVADIIKSVMDGCAAKVFLSIWILDEAGETNTLDGIFDHMGAFSANVHRLTLVDFNALGFAFLKTYNAWMLEHMPDLELIFCTVDVSGYDSKVQQIWSMAEDLSGRHWPPKLHTIVLIVADLDEELLNWKYSFRQQINDIECVLLYLKIAVNAEHSFTNAEEMFEVKKPEPTSESRRQEFAHSRECIATR